MARIQDYPFRETSTQPERPSLLAFFVALSAAFVFMAGIMLTALSQADRHFGREATSRQEAFSSFRIANGGQP